MKKILVTHIVNATTKHKKLVLSCAILICILSIISVLFFLKVDMSLMGIAGNTIKEVNDFNNLQEKFQFTSIINVVMQPTEDKIIKVGKYYDQINNLIYDNLNADGKEATLLIYKEFINKKIRTFNLKKTIYITIEMLNLFKYKELKELFKTIKSWTEKNKKYILSNINSNKSDVKRNIFKYCQLLSESELKMLISHTNKLNKNEVDKLIKVIIHYMSIYDKKGLVSKIEGIDESLKNNIISKIDEIDNKINDILREFSSKAEKIAKEMKNVYLSSTPTRNPKKGKTLKDIVKDVLFSDSLSLSPDSLMYMVIISPKIKLIEIINSRIFVSNIDYELNKIKEKYKGEIILHRTGHPVLVTDEEKSMLDGFSFMMGITILGILLIFLIGLKRLIYPVLSMIPLFIGILIMFGIYSLIVQTINIVTIVTPIILFGIGIDYAIHFGARYGEVRAKLGKDVSQELILEETFNSIGPGLMIGAITTIFSFLCLITSTIIGFINLAIMASSGVLTGFLCMIYILPIIVTWREKKHNTIDVEFLNSNKLIRLGRVSNSKAGTIIALILILLSLTSIIFIPKLEIEIEQDALRQKGLESIKYIKILGEKYDYPYTQTNYVVEKYDNLKKFKAEVRRKENGTPIYPTINPVSTMDAKKSIRALEKIGWDRNPDTLDEYIEKYAKKRNIMGGSNESAALIHNYILQNYINFDEKEEYLITIEAQGYVWHKEFFENHIKDLIKLGKNTNTTGSGLLLIWNFLVTNMLNDLLIASIIAFLIIFLILFLSTRNLTGTIACSISLLTAIISTLSIMSMLQFKINFVNILAFPVIIGLGIDYSVHIYYGLLYDKKMSIINVISSTGKAVLLTTLTTLIAFGSISFSAHPGLAKLGQIASIGIFLSLLSSLFIIPLFIKIFYRK